MVAPHYSSVRGFVFAKPPPGSGSGEDVLASRRRSWNAWLSLLTLDRTRAIRQVWEMVVFVARYAAQPIDAVERWPLSKVIRVATLTSELLREEAKKSAMPTASGRP